MDVDVVVVVVDEPVEVDVDEVVVDVVLVVVAVVVVVVDELVVLCCINVGVMAVSMRVARKQEGERGLALSRWKG